MRRTTTFLLILLGLFLLGGCGTASFSGDYVLGAGQTHRGNLYATSGSVTLEENSRVTGTVILTSGELFMRENSEVGKDVVMTSGAMYMADGAVVQGDVILSSQDIDVDQAPGAVVEGSINYNFVPFVVTFITRGLILYCVLPIILLLVVILGIGLLIGRASRKASQPSPAATPAAVSTPAATPPPAMSEDAQQKLQKLKAMLDDGLITEADYEAKKAEILSRM